MHGHTRIHTLHTLYIHAWAYTHTHTTHTYTLHTHMHTETNVLTPVGWKMRPSISWLTSLAKFPSSSYKINTHIFRNTIIALKVF